MPYFTHRLGALLAFVPALAVVAAACSGGGDDGGASNAITGVSRVIVNSELAVGVHTGAGNAGAAFAPRPVLV